MMPIVTSPISPDENNKGCANIADNVRCNTRKIT